MRWRALMLLVAACCLGGCNMVLSERPLFTAADAAAAPVLRSGLWASDSPECPFDATQPRATWPECAPDAQFIGPPRDGRYRVDTVELLIAAGDPLIVQVRDHSRKPDARDNPEERKLKYAYYAARITARDEAGGATAFAMWPVPCGPSPPRTEEKADRYVTEQRLPGLTVVGNNCRADDPAAVRRAVAASLDEVEKPPSEVRWLRDGKR